MAEVSREEKNKIIEDLNQGLISSLLRYLELNYPYMYKSYNESPPTIAVATPENVEKYIPEAFNISEGYDQFGRGERQAGTWGVQSGNNILYSLANPGILDLLSHEMGHLTSARDPNYWRKSFEEMALPRELQEALASRGYLTADMMRSDKGDPFVEILESFDPNWDKRANKLAYEELFLRRAQDPMQKLLTTYDFGPEIETHERPWLQDTIDKLSEWDQKYINFVTESFRNYLKNGPKSEYAGEWIK